MDLFRPQPVTPNARQKDSAIALHDNSQVAGGLLSSSLSFRQFNTSVWGQGTDDHVLTPQGEQGSYFGSNARRSSRIELFEVFTLTTEGMTPVTSLRRSLLNETRLAISFESTTGFSASVYFSGVLRELRLRRP